VSASFVPESDIWQCYMELTGGFFNTQWQGAVD
jgi:hypothetical protein